ncbi:MAG: NAD-dependent epimerase/dehydratase family protein, partial [Bacteroidota bacterium]
MACILIAGGNGLVGQRLTQVLQAAGHEVRWLVRNPNGREPVRTFAWKPERHELSDDALHQTDVIISLAGAPIAGSRWTAAYKHTILHSRLDAAKTLIGSLNNIPNKVSCVISASAIGFYGNRGHEILDEQSKMGKGFLSETTAAWESAYASCPVRHITIRIGIVLSRAGGALPKLEAPLRAGVASILGSGNQVMSWIHIDDLCALFL